MKLIKPYCEILPQAPGLEGVYKQIEIAGRTCYKSEDKITEDSAQAFVDRMTNSKHYAMLEHGTVYLHFNMYSREYYFKYCYNKYSVGVSKGEAEKETWEGFVTTNLRVLIENNWLDDLKYLCEPTKFHEKRYTFRIITSIGITRELIRHRVFSFANESTRYCNYSKDRFGGELTFIKPYWLQDSDTVESVAFFTSLEQSEKTYNKLTEMGIPAQAAREVLPLATKSEIIMTGFKSDWDRFLDIRLHQSTGPVHPDMLVIANMIDKQLP